MYAVIENSGKQYRVEEGMTLFKEKQTGYAEGDQIVFDKVLLLKDEAKTEIGKPYLESVKVVGKVVNHGKGRRMKVVKFGPRKSFDRVNGHRQWFTQIVIEKIEH